MSKSGLWLSMGVGVGQNHTPYCKVYIHRKYILLGDKTRVQIKIAIRWPHLSMEEDKPGAVEDNTWTYFF